MGWLFLEVDLDFMTNILLLNQIKFSILLNLMKTVCNAKLCQD